MDKRELIDAVAAAGAGARGLEPSDWDREVAAVAIRRWNSYERRKGAGKTGHDARVADLARGLLERFDSERMDERNWHRWTAEATAELLGRGSTR